ncbi:MAG: hypothetical protein LKF00_06370 [Olsenella sp.]|jgi:hypothetical protein|nr:hypothetical protein [Olsenella sp.]MCI1289130.1 hypothetical protein [Olsenella sp.]
MEARDVQAAREAGQRALASLREAEKSLDSARNWGFVDILGGGLITSLVKHSRMDDASEAIDRAQTDLEVFARALRGVSGVMGVRLERDGVLEAFDVLLDNSISDLFVQSHIEDARGQVRAAISRVTAILAELGQQDASSSTGGTRRAR